MYQGRRSERSRRQGADQGGDGVWRMCVTMPYCCACMHLIELCLTPTCLGNRCAPRDEYREGAF